MNNGKHRPDRSGEWQETDKAIAMLHDLPRDEHGYLRPLPETEIDAGRDALLQSALESEWKLETLGDLLDSPGDTAEFLVSGLLPIGGLSLLVGWPKAGKTTVARCLIMAVVYGLMWLGREIPNKGSCLYLALEEKRSEVARHFAELGARKIDPVHIAYETPEKHALEMLASLVKRLKPALVVVDPVIKLCRVQDINDYAAVTAALEPLLKLSRNHECHVMAVHHARKGAATHGQEALGSTALVGAVDAALFLKRDDAGQRSVYSLNRYGEDLPETVLSMDERGWIEPVGTKADVQQNKVVDQILDYLQTEGEPVTQNAIVEALNVRKADVGAALKRLVNQEKIERSGEGKKGKPFRFQFPTI